MGGNGGGSGCFWCLSVIQVNTGYRTKNVASVCQCPEGWQWVAMVEACSVAMVEACSVAMVEACSVAMVEACSVAMVEACSVAMVEACTYCNL
jgi:hypothetical protein